MKTVLSLQCALAVFLVLIWHTKSDDLLGAVKCKDLFQFQCKCGGQGMFEDVYVESCLVLNIHSNICQPCPGACEAFSRCKTCSTHGCLTCPQGKVGRFCEIEDSSNNNSDNDKSMASERKSTKQIEKEGFPANSSGIPSILPSKENSSEPSEITVESTGENATIILLEVDINRNATIQVSTQASAQIFRTFERGNASTSDIKPIDLEMNKILEEDHSQQHEDSLFNAEEKSSKAVKEEDSPETVLPLFEVFETPLKQETVYINSSKYIQKSEITKYTVESSRENATVILLEVDINRNATNEVSTQASAQIFRIFERGNVSTSDIKPTDLQVNKILEDHPQQHEESLSSAEEISAESIKEEHSLETVHPPLEVFETTATEKTENNETVTDRTKIKSEMPQDSSRKDNKWNRFHSNRERTSRKGMDGSRNSNSRGMPKITKPLSSHSDKDIHNGHVVLSTGHSHEQELMKRLMQIVTMTSRKDANEGKQLRNDSSIEPLSKNAKRYRVFSHEIYIPKHPPSRNNFISSNPKSRNHRPCRLCRTRIAQSPKNAPKHYFDRYDLVKSEVTNFHSPNIKSNNGASPIQFDTQLFRAINIINNVYKNTLITTRSRNHRRKSKQDKCKKSEIKVHSNPSHTRLSYRAKLKTLINTETRHKDVPLSKLKRPLNFDLSYPYNADRTSLAHRRFQVPKTHDSFVGGNADKNNRKKSNFENSFINYEGWYIQDDTSGRGIMMAYLPSLPYWKSSKMEPKDYLNSRSSKKTSANWKKIIHRIPHRTFDTSSASSEIQRCNSTAGDCSTTSSVDLDSTRPQVTNFHEETTTEKEFSFKHYSSRPDKIRITHLRDDEKSLGSRITIEQYTQHDDLVTGEESRLDTTVKPGDDYIRINHLHDDDINGTQRLYNETDWITVAYEKEMTTDSKKKNQEHLFRIKRKSHGDFCLIKKDIRHGDLDCTVWSYQKICSLRCHPGYTAPSRKFKCLADGPWVPPMMPCVSHRYRGHIGYKALDPESGSFIAEDKAFQLNGEHGDEAIKASQSNDEHDDEDIKESQSNGEHNDEDIKASQSNDEHGDGAIKASQSNGEYNDEDIKASQSKGEHDDESIKASQLNGKHDDESIKASQSNGEYNDEDIKASQSNGKHDDEDIKASQSNGEHDDEGIKASQSNSEHNDEDIKASQSNGKHDDEDIKASQSNGEHDDEGMKASQSNGEQDDGDIKASQSNGEHVDEGIKASQSNGEHVDEGIKASQSNGEHDNEGIKASQSDGEYNDEDIKASQLNGEHDDEDIKAPQLNGQNGDEDITVSQPNGKYDDYETKKL